MKIMCLDSGVAHLGVAVFEIGPGAAEVVELALIETDKDPRRKRVRVADDDARRVMEAYRALSGLVVRHGVKRLAAEMPVGGAQNAGAVKHLAYASAIVACLVAQHDLFHEFYSAGEVKRQLAGSWFASKKLVAEVIEARYPQVLSEFPTWARREHVVDALAVFETASALGNVCKI